MVDANSISVGRCYVTANREVRKVLAHLGLQVSRLIRTSYGPFSVEGMGPGDVGEVQREQLFRFRQTLK